MDNNKSIMDHLIAFFSLVPMILYMIVAIMLTIIAFFSVYDAAQSDRRDDHEPEFCRRARQE